MKKMIEPCWNYTKRCMLCIKSPTSLGHKKSDVLLTWHTVYLPNRTMIHCTCVTSKLQSSPPPHPTPSHPCYSCNYWVVHFYITPVDITWFLLYQLPQLFMEKWNSLIFPSFTNVCFQETFPAFKTTCTVNSNAVGMTCQGFVISSAEYVLILLILCLCFLLTG